ncbi:hypothetical protein SDJN02_26025, partial [Cucurbita argyrosperma subsp. argyrosperma]
MQATCTFAPPPANSSLHGRHYLDSLQNLASLIALVAASCLWCVWVLWDPIRSGVKKVTIWNRTEERAKNAGLDGVFLKSCGTPDRAIVCATNSELPLMKVYSLLSPVDLYVSNFGLVRSHEVEFGASCSNLMGLINGGVVRRRNR